MNWTPLSTLGERTYHSPATAKRRVELNHRIGQLLQQRQDHDEYLSGLRSADVATIRADQVFQADCPALNRFELLQRELQLRSELQTFHTAQDADRKDAFGRAIDVAQKRREEVAAALKKIGYLELQTPPIRGSILPGYIHNHPAVIEAAGYASSLSDPDPNIHPNAEAIAVVMRQLDALRERAVGA